VAVLNSLPEILQRLRLPRDARVLDVGGPAYRGEETTRYLVEAFDSPIDVVAYKPEQREGMAGFGKAIRLLDSEVSIEPGTCDLVIISPILARVIETITDATWRATRLLKPGGYLVCFGIESDVIGREGYRQPDPDQAAEFDRLFPRVGHGRRGLPESLAGAFEFVESPIRKPNVQSYLTWFVLRRTAGAVPEPLQTPLISGTAAGFVTAGLLDDGLDAAVESILERDFDTVMVVDNPVVTDARVMKTAETVSSLGRKLLCIGLNREPVLEVVESAGGVPVIQFANPRVEIDRRLRAVGAPMETSLRYELRMAVFAEHLVRVFDRVAKPGLILHSHDFQPFYAAGAALEMLDPAKARMIGWVHDIHEFISDYGIIDPGLQALGARWEARYIRKADALTAVSDEICAALAGLYGVPAPVSIYNTQRLADRYRHRGKTIREKLELTRGEPILVHSGSVREGRGVDHVLRCLPQLPSAHLALLTGSRTDYVKGLQHEARRLGVSDRLHLLAPIAYERVPGFIADATVGLIPADLYGNADVGLPNKFSDYVMAGLPIVSSATAAMAALMREWPVGVTFKPGDGAALLAALREVLANPGRHAAEIGRRPDLMVHYSWEAQAVKLKGVYDRLAAGESSSTRAA
jgi:glycosyltransferase involved in cell wall biosynthesis